MEAGFTGTFVIPWALTEVDGIRGAPRAALAVGSSWRRQGEALRVDGPNDLLRLDGAWEGADLRRRAARSVQRLVGVALKSDYAVHDDPAEFLHDKGFVLTDGARSYTATEIATGPSKPPLLMFVNELPPAGRELWVVRTISEQPPLRRQTDGPKGVICFIGGTRVQTPTGPRQIQDLAEGDLVSTKDNGPQPIIWTGSRHISGARLYAMPELRPVRLRAGALGQYRPDSDLVVSPLHRLLVKGRAADLLFNAPEVLVTAKDLINDRTITPDYTLKHVTYFHLMMESHQILIANGVETESFHPANTELEVLSAEQRTRLLDVCPAVARDPGIYGSFARRNLSQSEAAILMSELL